MDRKEIVTLVFNDGSRFNWKAGSIHDARMAMKLQKKKGHPKEIIGEGSVARMLREKYARFNQDRANYKPDLMGTASALSGLSKTAVEEKFDRISRKLGFKK